MKYSSILLFAVLLTSTSVLAADLAPQIKPIPARTAEVAKPAAASPNGSGAKADPRSAAGTVKVAGGSQQNRMKECNKSATGKKGPERRAFMKSCLSTRKG